MADMDWIDRTVETRLTRTMWRDKYTGEHYFADNPRQFDDVPITDYWEETEYGTVIVEPGMIGDPNLGEIRFASGEIPTAEYRKLVREWQEKVA